MKNNIDYYPHMSDADQHQKFKVLRVKYGWEGEGRFWALNNRIAKAENCCLDLEKGYNFAALADDLRMSADELSEYLNYIEIECDLIVKTADGYTTDIIQEALGKVMADRRKARERKVRYSGGSPEKDKSSPERNKRVKESKVKETKVKKKKKTLSSFFDEIWSDYPNKDGKKEALRHYLACDGDNRIEEIRKALANYKKMLSKETWRSAKNGSTWFNNWEDWLDYKPEDKPTNAAQNFTLEDLNWNLLNVKTPTKR